MDTATCLGNPGLDLAHHVLTAFRTAMILKHLKGIHGTAASQCRRWPLCLHPERVFSVSYRLLSCGPVGAPNSFSITQVPERTHGSGQAKSQWSSSASCCPAVSSLFQRLDITYLCSHQRMRPIVTLQTFDDEPSRIGPLLSSGQGASMLAWWPVPAPQEQRWQVPTPTLMVSPLLLVRSRLLH